MADFRSEAPYLVLQNDDGVWASFVDHEFSTTDKTLIGRLQKVDGVTEVKATKAEAEKN